MKMWPCKAKSRFAVAIGIWILCSAALAPGSLVHAAEKAPEAKPQSPIQITADRLVTEGNSNSADFIGNVKVVQDQTTITSDRLKVIYRKGGNEGNTLNSDAIESIEATGHVRIVFDNRVAVSEKAIYIAAERKLVLSGKDSSLSNGRDKVVGSKIVFHRDNGHIEMTGDNQNQVKATFYSDQMGLN